MLAARLYDPTRGSVKLNGVDLRDLDPAELRRAVGVVTQDPHLFHDTLGANLRYGNPGASDEEVREALARAQVLDLVDRLPDGLDTEVGERGVQLSAGQRQLVAFARAIAGTHDELLAKGGLYAELFATQFAHQSS